MWEYCHLCRIQILEKIFTALIEAYLQTPPVKFKLLPEVTHQLVIQMPGEQQKMRIICDHIAGMTDGFAIRTYRRLFDPGFGSIADLI